MSRSILDLSGDIAQARRQRDLAHPIEHSSSLASPEAAPASARGVRDLLDRGA
ncbi:MAG: hypothetical protein ACP5P4_10345 [Steroidobacteraceae bacterium]